MTDINTQRALKKIYRLATAFITGALPVVGQELGIETFTNSGVVVTPIAGVSIAYLTVPAGCYTVSLRPVVVTGGGFTALSLPCGIAVNAAANINTGYILQPADDELRIAVNPADTIAFIGATGTAGNVLAYFLG